MPACDARHLSLKESGGIIRLVARRASHAKPAQRSQRRRRRYSAGRRPAGNGAFKRIFSY